MRSLSSHAAIIGSCIFSVWMLSLLTVRAQEYLTFAPKVHAINVQFEVLSYKEIRSREICTMAKEAGFSDKDCTLMIAHLYQENGSMSEDGGWKKGDKSNDYGYAIGIAQWHVCWRHTEWAIKNGYCWKTKGGGMAHGISNAAKMREHYFKDFPDMLDWRNQAARYIREMKDCTAQKSLYACVDGWNSNPQYMTFVYGKLSTARSLLAL